MYRISFMIVIFQIVFCIIAACGHKGPPRPPKDESVTQAGFTDYPSTRVKNLLKVKINVSIWFKNTNYCGTVF